MVELAAMEVMEVSILLHFYAKKHKNDNNNTCEIILGDGAWGTKGRNASE